MSTSFNEKHLDATPKYEDIALATGEISELTVVAEGEERTTIFVWLLVCVSSISGLLFGEFWALPCVYVTIKHDIHA
jgi:MFS transporter, SP family, solute carrier family 2 (myo-inositol transporter), member 13